MSLLPACKPPAARWAGRGSALAPRGASEEGSVARVFISYRRADSATFAGRIYDRLVARFGAKNVYRDVDDIPIGVRFAEYIQDSLRQCAVALVLIGREWVQSATPEGTRRLDDPADFVRVEIETAFALGLRVIPVLVEGAGMPAAATLPESL